MHSRALSTAVQKQAAGVVREPAAQQQRIWLGGRVGFAVSKSVITKCGGCRAKYGAAMVGCGQGAHSDGAATQWQQCQHTVPPGTAQRAWPSHLPQNWMHCSGV